jgi:hypothetical protein
MSIRVHLNLGDGANIEGRAAIWDLTAVGVFIPAQTGWETACFYPWAAIACLEWDTEHSANFARSKLQSMR